MRIKAFGQVQISSFLAVCLFLGACGSDPETVTEVVATDVGLSDVGLSDLGSDDDAATAADLGAVEDLGNAEDVGSEVDMAGADSGTPTNIPQMLLDATNAARAVEQDCGGTLVGPVPALTLNAALTVVAQARADEMAAADQVGGPTASQTDAAAAGYVGFVLGENFGFGQNDVDEFVAAYLDSESTCNNIMSAAATEMGVGYAARYWSQVFGGPEQP